MKNNSNSCLLKMVIGVKVLASKNLMFSNEAISYIFSSLSKNVSGASFLYSGTLNSNGIKTLEQLREESLIAKNVPVLTFIYSKTLDLYGLNTLEQLREDIA